MKKIAFVTGATGFVGSHLVEYLLENNIEVHCIMRKSSNTKWLNGLNVIEHRGGIEENYLKELFRQYKPNYVFHIAGIVNARDYEGYEIGNVHPTREILNAALISAENIEKILITSSLAATTFTQVGHPIDESSPREPLTLYGKSKVEEENLAISFMDRLPIVIVRPPAVYGERDTEILLFFKTIKNHIMPMIGFKPKTLSIVYVGDLIRGMYQAVTSTKTTGQTYFLGGVQNEYSWETMGETASKSLHVKVIPLKVPEFLVYSIAFISQTIAKLRNKIATLDVRRAREMSCPSWSCKSDKAKQDFGYNPSTDIEEGFTKTISWYQNQGWL